MIPKLSVFNRIIGDSGFELEFAAFLDSCQGEIVSFAKNYFAVGFKLDYVNADGDISNYYPDFFVKVSGNEIYIVETKGQEDLDVPLKMARLKQWCDDINQAQQAMRYAFVFVDEEGFKKYQPKTFAALVKSFREHKE
jgi:type III restriction enzyme